MRRTLLALLVLLGAGVVVSRFVPKVASVTVTGNAHHDRQRIMLLAGVQVKTGVGGDDVNIHALRLALPAAAYSPLPDSNACRCRHSAVRSAAA